MTKKTMCALFLIVGVFGSVAAKTAGKFPPNGLVGEWNFNEGKGSIIHDNVGWIGKLTAFGGPKWVKNASGYCMYLDGKPDGAPVYLQWPNRYAFRQIMPNGKMMCERGGSYSFWVKPVNGGFVYPKDNLAPVFWVWVMITDRKKWQVLFRTPNVKISGPKVTDDWTHIAVTWNNSYGRFYVNGKLIRAPGGEVMINPQMNDNPKSFFNIGLTNPESKKHAFTGYLDDLRYYSVPLTEEQVAAQYKEGLGKHKLVK